jgi:hypothetical protein
MSTAETTRWTGVGLAIVISIIALALAALAAHYTSERSSPLIGRESQRNVVESAAVQVIIGGLDTSICSGVFIDSIGTFVTAVHCLQEPTTCEFDPVVGEYPLVDAFYMVEIMGINGSTTEKYTMFAEVVGWAGLPDVMLMRVVPFTKEDGSVITLVSQPHFQFGPSWELQKGQIIAGLSFDFGFITKLGHFGAVQAIQKDRGSSFAVSIDQVFFDGNSEPGSSGSGIFNEDKQVVFAPLTYGWMAGDDTSNVFSVSGTSSRVTAPLVKRMLNPDTPPNGPAHNKYLLPALGINPMFVVSGLDLWLNFDIGNLAATQSKGIIFFWLATQEFYDFLTTDFNDCGFPPYTVTPPSLLNAPLDVTLGGTPPDPFADFPACCDPDTIVALEAMELTLDRGDWYEVGEDSGLETVSGVLARGHFWEGDVIRVRIRSWNIASPTDPTMNWEGIYRVTLQHVDPFWDTIQLTYFVSYAAYIRVNTTGASGRRGIKKNVLHMEPGHVMPHLMAGHPDGTIDPVTGKERLATRAMGSTVFSPVPNGADIYTLPTMAELYMQSRKRAVPPALKGNRRARRAKQSFPKARMSNIHKRRGTRSHARL